MRRRHARRVSPTDAKLDKLYRLVHERAIALATGMPVGQYQRSIERARWALMRAGMHPGKIAWEELKAEASASALLDALT